MSGSTGIFRTTTNTIAKIVTLIHTGRAHRVRSGSSHRAPGNAYDAHSATKTGNSATNHRLYRAALTTSPRTNCPSARVPPQNGHHHPVTTRNGHGRPNACRVGSNAATTAHAPAAAPASSHADLAVRASSDWSPSGAWAGEVTSIPLKASGDLDQTSGFIGVERYDLAMTSTSPATPQSAPAPTTRWTNQWKELKAEVIDADLCTGCAGCVISCPHDVIGYHHEAGGYTPFHLEDELGPNDCGHGQKGCTSCTRACPRFRAWEFQANEHLFERSREPDEVAGIYQDILLTRASDDMVHQMGQDGGLVSAILIWAIANDYIDAALVSFLEGDATSWKPRPGVAHTREEILAAGGSRYTYSANTLALDEALEQGHRRLALVGMSCQSSVPPVMWSRKIGKISKPILFNIGLLCSKTFDDAIFEELFEAKYRIKRTSITKMNIKGVFQIWTDDGEFHEINLKECHAWTRDGCNHCPDFAAEHADISTGGIGRDNDWTLTIVRTDLGREIVSRMIADGSIIARPGDEDPAAIALMRKLAEKSRSRWPTSAEPGVRVGVTSKP